MKKAVSKRMQAVPDKIAALGNPPEPIKFDLYGKMRQLVASKQNKEITTLINLSYYLRGTKDTLKVTANNGSFTVEELSQIAQIFKVPIELFFSPKTAMEYMMEVSGGNDTKGLVEQLHEYQIAVQDLRLENESLQKEIRQLKKAKKQ